MTNLLILSSDTGEGHNSAAAALGHSASQAGLKVSIRKPLEESGKFNHALAKLYNVLLTHRPQWMARYFWLVNRTGPDRNDFLYSIGRGFFREFLNSNPADTMLSVHPMLNHFLQRFSKEEGLRLLNLAFVTDPFPPFWQGWASPHVDRYFVATPEALQALTAMGVPAWRIERVPMPVRPEFVPLTMTELHDYRQQWQLDGGSTILISGGARGGGPVMSIYRTVRKAAPNANIMVICGRNDRLRRNLDETIEKSSDRRTRSLGFVHDIHRHVAAADLVLTKPGALSTYESLACGVPVLLLGMSGLMPQESGLFRAAAHFEFGFAASSMSDVSEIIDRGPAAWSRLRSSIEQFYRRSSGKELIERIQPHHVGT